MQHIFILCAGTATRWEEYMNAPKQLVEIHGESLLDRTLRLLSEQGCLSRSVHIVSWNEKLRRPPSDFVNPGKTSCIIETLLTTQELWGEENIFLLGDVFYDAQALDKILNSRKEFACFGRPDESIFTTKRYGELFGLVFMATQSQAVLKALNETLDYFQSGKGRGKIWELYRAMTGLDKNRHVILDKNFIFLDDVCDDFDRPRDYQRHIKRYEGITSENSWLRFFTKHRFMVWRRLLRGRRILSDVGRQMLGHPSKRAKIIFERNL